MTRATRTSMQDRLDRRVQPPGFWEPAAAQEMFGAWLGACSVWGDYLERLATALGPMAVLDAGTRLMADSLEICSRAAAARLGADSLGGPLLNDP